MYADVFLSVNATEVSVQTADKGLDLDLIFCLGVGF